MTSINLNRDDHKILSACRFGSCPVLRYESVDCFLHDIRHLCANSMLYMKTASADVPLAFLKKLEEPFFKDKLVPTKPLVPKWELCLAVSSYHGNVICSETSSNVHLKVSSDGVKFVQHTRVRKHAPKWDLSFLLSRQQKRESE